MASPATIPRWAAAAAGAQGPVSAIAGQVERQGPTESSTAGLCRAGGLGSTGFSWRQRPAAATAGKLWRSQLQRQGLSQFCGRWPSGPGLERSLAWGVPQPHRRPGPGGKPVPRAGGGLAPLAGRARGKYRPCRRSGQPGVRHPGRFGGRPAGRPGPGPRPAAGKADQRFKGHRSPAAGTPASPGGSGSGTGGPQLGRRPRRSGPARPPVARRRRPGHRPHRSTAGGPDSRPPGQRRRQLQPRAAAALAGGPAHPVATRAAGYPHRPWPLPPRRQ